MKKIITDEKFYITDIPKDYASRAKLSNFLGLPFNSNWIALNTGIDILSFVHKENRYLFLSKKSKKHTVITYDDLLANYLPKDTKIETLQFDDLSKQIATECAISILNEQLKFAKSLEVDTNEDYQKPNKYKKQCKGIEIDVYDVLKAFNVVNPAIQHAIKKLLAGGQRGYKDIIQDYNEAIQSLQRGIELENQK